MTKEPKYGVFAWKHGDLYRISEAIETYWSYIRAEHRAQCLTNYPPSSLPTPGGYVVRSLELLPA